MELKLPEKFRFDEGKRIPQEYWDEILPTLTPPERIKKHCLLEGDNMSYFTRPRKR